MIKDILDLHIFSSTTMVCMNVMFSVLSVSMFTERRDLHVIITHDGIGQSQFKTDRRPVQMCYTCGPLATVMNPQLPLIHMKPKQLLAGRQLALNWEVFLYFLLLDPFFTWNLFPMLSGRSSLNTQRNIVYILNLIDTPMCPYVQKNEHPLMDRRRNQKLQS